MLNLDPNIFAQGILDTPLPYSKTIWCAGGGCSPGLDVSPRPHFDYIDFWPTYETPPPPAACFPPTDTPTPTANVDTAGTLVLMLAGCVWFVRKRV